MEFVMSLQTVALAGNMLAVLLMLVSLTGNVSKRTQKMTLIAAMALVCFSALVTAFG